LLQQSPEAFATGVAVAVGQDLFVALRLSFFASASFFCQQQQAWEALRSAEQPQSRQSPEHSLARACTNGFARELIEASGERVISR